MKFKKNDMVVIINTDNIWEYKKGVILSDADKKDITDETEDYLVKVFFGNDKTIIQPFNEKNLELEEDDELVEYLTESKQKEKDNDFIHDYVYLEDLDDKVIHAWFFVDKLAAAENITAEEVILAAKALGYKLFEVGYNTFKKVVVAAPKCKAELIQEEYADYLLGGVATVVEILDKGE